MTYRHKLVPIPCSMIEAYNEDYFSDYELGLLLGLILDQVDLLDEFEADRETDLYVILEKKLNKYITDVLELEITGQSK